MQTGPPIRMRQNQPQDDELYWHRIHIVPERFYGRDPRADGYRLRLFSRSEVEAIVRTAFQNQVFLEDTLTNDVTLLIVPDHWKENDKFAKRDLFFIPFSYVLHPTVSDRAHMNQLMAPTDAEFRVMLYQKHAGNTASSSSGFDLNRIAQDTTIPDRFRGFSLDRPLSTRNSSSSRKSWNAESKTLGAYESTSTFPGKTKLTRQSSSRQTSSRKPGSRKPGSRKESSNIRYSEEDHENTNNHNHLLSQGKGSRKSLKDKFMQGVFNDDDKKHSKKHSSEISSKAAMLPSKKSIAGNKKKHTEELYQYD